MKYFILLVASITALAADKKPVPNQAGNDEIRLAGAVMLSHQEIQQALGAELGEGYIVVRITATPKTDKPIWISPDDFTLLSRKNGDRCQAMEPGEIAGKGELVIKPAAQQPGGDGTATNGPIWGGVAQRIGGSKAKKDGNGSAAADPKVQDTPSDSSLLGLLKQKILPDKETKAPLEGLLYFQIDGKLKPKDLSLLYRGTAGHLVMDFK